jgi:hypothetical protein
VVDKELLVNETRKGRHHAHRTRGLDTYEYRAIIFAGDLPFKCTHVSSESSRIQAGIEARYRAPSTCVRLDDQGIVSTGP